MSKSGSSARASCAAVYIVLPAHASYQSVPLTTEIKGLFSSEMSNVVVIVIRINKNVKNN